MATEQEDDEFFDYAIDAAEHKHDLERAAREGTDIRNEVDSGGPLGWYMRTRRAAAMAALDGLTTVDPNDPVGITRLQEAVREYMNVRSWVREKFAAGEYAKTVLREEFGDEETRGRDNDDQE